MKWIFAFFLSINFVAFSQYEVGETVINFVDSERDDRAIETHIFYPAESGGTEEPVTEGTFPVIAVGHGFAMSFDAYEYIWEHLVPLGYIVALPNTETGLAVSHEAFGKDLAYVLTALQTENGDEASFFFDRISDRTAVVGHSMGGGTGVLAVSESPTITSLITLAAAETDPSAIAAANEIDQPSLTIAGSLDCVTPPEEHQNLIFENHNDCKGYILIEGGSHCQFANSNFVCELGEITCAGEGVIDEAAQHEIVLDVITDWLTVFLKNDMEIWESVTASVGDNDGYTFELSCEENGPVLSIEELNERPVQIYPNPAVDYLMVSGVQNQHYSIIAMDGQIVSSGYLTDHIDVRFLEKGIYILQLRTAPHQWIQKRIIKA